MAFGCPMGAILFSIEVATTYYMVSNLFKEFFCVCFVTLIYKIFEMLNWLVIFVPTLYPMGIVIDHEIFFFAILGIICGLVGALYVQVMTRIVFLRTRVKIPFISDRWKWCIGVGLITGLIKYPVYFMMLSDYKIMNVMFAKHELHDTELGSLFTHPSNSFNLSMYCIL
jgi:H+/Cl- antiporter ClcA